MKTLINNIELISFSYMNSNNNTINKFGIEYSYIALAMNNMLEFTNNNVKNISIDKTNAIAIDYNWWCVIGLASYIAAWIGIIGGAFYVPATLGGAAALWLFSLFAVSSLGTALVAHGCGW